MRGLTKGEESTSTNPALQLFIRLGEFLADPISATYRIEDIHNPDVAPVVKVANTSFNLDDIGLGGNRLGVGRYYIPVGLSTSTDFSYGTHRVVCNYVMVTGGRSYSQVIDFEVLDAAYFPTGDSYIGYATTRSLVDNGFLPFSYAPEKVHRHIRRASIELENITSRFFEPRYFQMDLDGMVSTALFVDEAIIAVEKVEVVATDGSGVETLEAFDSSLYRVYNRHLDGLLNPDDRDNPLLSMGRTRYVPGVTSSHGESHWPSGKQNIRITGVFGFTDPDPRSDKILIGHTPDDFQQILGVMIDRFLTDPTLSSMATQQPGLVKSYKTRDQAIHFYGASGNVSYTGGWTGDTLLDQKLQRFVKPARVRYTERD